MTISLSAQNEYGVSAGFYNSERNTIVLFDTDGQGNKENFNRGFYLGAFAGLKLSERFYIQPEIIFASIQNDFSQLNIPILGRYRIGNNFKVFQDLISNIC